jgi:orotidine-5'-phosphate decarboxylase
MPQFSNFRQALIDRQQKTHSLLCVGLDPTIDKVMPNKVMLTEKDAMYMEDWLKDIVRQTASVACMFKPQSAHYEAMPHPFGRTILRNIVKFIHDDYPDVPVVEDCKRGDIDRTQLLYGKAILINDDLDGMNFSPYMGKDCMEKLIDPNNLLGKGIIGLCYTSNKSARQVQDVKLENGQYYYEFIAQRTYEWAKELNILPVAGLVMAAAYPTDSDVFFDHLCRIRDIVKDEMWFLIPGIGTQGGEIESTVKYSFAGWGTTVINSSSGIIFADDPGKKAQEAYERMLAAIPNI